MHGSGRRHAVGAGLAIWALLGGAGAGTGQEPGSERWYLSASGGTTTNPTMRQTGHNRDTICYPTFLCGGTPGGYRWSYDLVPDPGPALELAAGRSFGGVRLEVSAARRSNSVEEEFTGITFLDRSPVLPNGESGYTSTTTTRVDAVTVRTLTLNAYRDFRIGGGRVVPYLGAGLGLALSELSGLFFSSEYSCVDEPCSGRPAAEYNSRQDTDLSDSGLAVLLFAGADYRLGTSLLVGLKASYGRVGDLQATSRYDVHPLPGTNSTTISGITPWSAMLGLKYLVGN